MATANLTKPRRATHEQHGLHRSGAYKSWQAMLKRCHTIGTYGWKWYGGRGISVCPQWRISFEAFFADMGHRPPNCTLDRIKTDGNYEPGNCKWSLPKEQARNRRTARMITYQGRTMCVADWADITGIPRKRLGYRFRHGWSPERAFTTPKLKNGF